MNIFCFGQTQNGELGLGGIEEDSITRPTIPIPLVNTINEKGSQYTIKSIACGQYHSLILLSKSMDDGNEDGQSLVLSCGSNERSQLGRHGSWKRFEEIDALRVHQIKSLACGSNHSLALTEAGQVFSWGDNSYGQLGIGKIDAEIIAKPHFIKKLGPDFIVQIACGSNHSFALTKFGTLYGWGSNQYGQLTMSCKSEHYYYPQEIRHFSAVPLKQISAGESHSIALSATGALYAWGKNNFGQLGLGDSKDRSTPSVIKSIRTQKIQWIACGEDHTAALTQDGGLFTFGQGMYGQLGHSNFTCQYLPRRITELMGDSVIQVSCGRRHTLVVVGPRKRVYAFGLNGSGQLGIGNTNNKNIPIKVEGPWIEVEQRISRCSIDSIDGKEQEKYVTIDDSPLSSEDIVMEEDDLESDESGKKKYSVHEVIASRGDQSFILVSESGNRLPTKDFRQTCNVIQTINNKDLEEVRNLKSDKPVPLELLDYIETTFSSVPSWNASYLDECNSNMPSIDWPSSLHGFHCLEETENNRVVEIISSIISSQLIPSLPQTFNEELLDSEILRVYLLLPLFHLFHFGSRVKHILNGLIMPFAKSVLSLNDLGKKTLMNFWAQALDERHFKELIKCYKRSVVEMLDEQKKITDDEADLERLRRGGGQSSSRDLFQNPHPFDNYNQSQPQRPVKIDYLLHENLRLSMELLGFLYKVNILNKKVDHKEFYISELSDLVDVKLDYVYWLVSKSKRTKNQLFICDYSFLFDINAKTLILAADSNLQQQNAAESVIYRSMFVGPVVFMSENPHLVISVSRNSILQDTFSELLFNNKHSNINYKKPLKINFIGEEAVDAGAGMKKEFFLLLIKEFLDPKYGMFNEFTETNSIWFNPGEVHELQMYQLLGLICGLAIYNQVIIYLPFPLVLYKRILDEPLGINDLGSLDYTLAKNLNDILVTTYTCEEFNDIYQDINFTITLNCFGSPVEFELVADGKNKTLNYENREEYVDLYWRFILIESVKNQFEAFKSGFVKVLDLRILSIFHGEELQTLVTGIDAYNWDVLEKESTEYKEPFNPKHPTIIMFWRIFHTLTEEQKKQFLLFLTGSDRIPVLGMKSLKIFIVPVKVSENHLPVAHTCFNILDLPIHFSSEDKLRGKLLQAIQHTQGFALA